MSNVDSKIQVGEFEGIPIFLNKKRHFYATIGKTKFCDRQFDRVIYYIKQRQKFQEMQNMVKKNKFVKYLIVQAEGDYEYTYEVLFLTKHGGKWYYLQDSGNVSEYYREVKTDPNEGVFFLPWSREAEKDVRKLTNWLNTFLGKFLKKSDRALHSKCLCDYKTFTAA